MAVLSYKDPGTGQWVALAGPAGSAGPSGSRGNPGPNVVSADAGNVAVLGTDGLPFVPGADTASMDLDYVNLSGDTMTGELALPDQIATPPSAPTTVAARGYVDQVVTASVSEPTGVPSRDGLVWIVIEES
jgi:hypothetical protein